MRLTARADGVEIRDVPWLYWSSAAFVLAGIANYARAIWVGDPELNAFMPIWLHVAVLGLFLALGLYLLAQPVSTAVADASRREMIVERRHLLWRTRTRVPFADIAAFSPEVAYDSDVGSRSVQHRLTVRLTGGKVLALTVWHQNGSEVQAAAEELRKCLAA